MKGLIFLFFVIGISILFFSCSQDNPTSPGTNKTDLVTKFSGAEKFIAMHNPGTWTPLPNGHSLGEGGVYEYRDEASDSRVSGKVMFYVIGVFDSTFSGKFWGTGELTPDTGGSWDLKVVGERIATKGSFADVIGHGKGTLEGMVAQWTYTRLEPEKDDFTFDGFIIEQSKN